MKDLLSVLIGTYNRCNGDEGFPLIWTLDSIKEQSYATSVLLADDGSDEQHSQKIKKKCLEYGFTYIKSNKRLGCSGIRKFALDFIESPWHLILDDDSVFYENKTLEKIANSVEEIADKNIGTVIYPAYDRVPFPVSFVPIDKIGKVDSLRGITSWFLNSFPEEYMNSPEKVPEIEIFTGGSYGAYNTSIVKRLGGFRSGGKNDFAMESELIWRMRKQGYKAFYSSNPDKGCLHLRFGIKSETTPLTIIQSLNYDYSDFVKKIFGQSPEEMLNRIVGGKRLYELINISNNFFDGGCRITEKEWIKDRISNEFGQVVAYYPFLDKFAGGISYVGRIFEHAKDFRISRRRNGLSTPCNKDTQLTQTSQFINILKGLIKGVYNGIIWTTKKY